ncbi:MAG: hypothetical protein AAF798_12510 [Bacteroidota bacterium]
MAKARHSQYQLLIKAVLLVLLLVDLSWSCLQYHHQPIGGDLTALVLPDARNATILEEPFGFKAIFEGERYVGTNRYFAHKSLAVYFKTVPFWIQHFVSPMESIYLSATLLKMAVHLGYILLLSCYILGGIARQPLAFLGTLLFCSALFQAYGYYDTIGVIAGSPTYLSFYGIPILLFLFFLWPFYRSYQLDDYQWSWHRYALLCPLILYLPFSGPLVAPLVLLSSPLVLFALRKKLGIAQNILLVALWFLCLYSFYLGQFNAENQQALAYPEALRRMGSAVLFLLSSKLGLPLILSFLLINAGLLYRQRQFLLQDQWLFLGLALVLFVYLMALPLGGYRDYRPNILRHDTLIPVTLGLFWALGRSCWYILPLLKSYRRAIYLSAIGLFLIIFTLADFNGLHANACERNLLQQLSQSTAEVVSLPATCPLWAWGLTISPEQSETTGKLLFFWGIVDREVRFVQGE